MKFCKKLLGSLLLLGAASAYAQPNCGMFQQSIDESLKRIATERVGGLVDNSAPRETMRKVAISNEIGMMQLNIQLMTLNKCALPGAPLDASVYLSDALGCENALLKGEKDSPACDKKTWKKSGS